MKEAGKILIIFVISVFLAVVILIFYWRSSNSRTQNQILQQTPNFSTSGQSEIFESKDLDLTIIKPKDFEIKPSSTSIELLHPSGSVVIVRNGTQFSSLDDYIRDFDSKRSISILESGETIISSNPSRWRIEERIVGGQEKRLKVYYVFSNSAVYIFSTSSEELYDELDQIARSFKYTS